MLQKHYQYLVCLSLGCYGCLSWTDMLHLHSFHLRNILDTIPFHLLVYFSLTSIFWLYSLGLMGGNRCLYSADDFNVRRTASLNLWAQTSREEALTEKS